MTKRRRTPVRLTVAQLDTLQDFICALIAVNEGNWLAGRVGRRSMERLFLAPADRPKHRPDKPDDQGG